jgi:PIN domain nuclease of toxin-antitoxin system
LNLLLDTHIALWAITDSPKLPHTLVEPMRLMTHDPLVALYSDTIIKI